MKRDREERERERDKNHISGCLVETINLSGNECDFRSNNRTLTNDMI
jgi:hypothetical protein